MPRKIIETTAAPSAIGAYSQAVAVNGTVYLSGQIPLVPDTMELVSDDPRTQVVQVFRNLSAVTEAAGGALDAIVKLNVYLTDLSHFPIVNEVMGEFFSQPFPARAAVEVSALPKGARVEVEGVMVLDD